MKTAFVLVAMFAIVPLAWPKGAPGGGPTGPTFSVSCDASDYCFGTGSGLAPSSTYTLEVSDSCGATVLRNNVNTSATGGLGFGFYAGESGGCASTGWTFTLWTAGRRSSLVATYTAADPD